MKKLLSVTALCALSVPALAVDNNMFYGSVGSGVYRVEADGFDDKASMWRFLGGYKFTDNIALESSYSRLSDASDVVDGTKITISGNVWDLAAKLSYPVTDRISPYGRLGWSYGDFKAVATDDGETERLNHYDNAFTWGVGTDVQLTSRLAMNGGYSRTGFKDVDLDYLSLNLNYRFGAG